jgi:hypothetical protein
MQKTKFNRLKATMLMLFTVMVVLVVCEAAQARQDERYDRNYLWSNLTNRSRAVDSDDRAGAIDEQRRALLSTVQSAAESAQDCPYLQSRMRELAGILSRKNFFLPATQESIHCRGGATGAVNDGNHVYICPGVSGLRMNFYLLHESAHSTRYNIQVYRGADCDYATTGTFTENKISRHDVCPGEEDADMIAMAIGARTDGRGYGNENYQCTGSDDVGSGLGSRSRSRSREND